MAQTSSTSVRNPVRRRFLKESASVAGAAALIATGVTLHATQSAHARAVALRPPGARAEEDFLAACVRCGLCVRDCPFDTLRLAKPGEGAPIGTPYFTQISEHAAAGRNDEVRGDIARSIRTLLFFIVAAVAAVAAAAIPA